LPVLASLALKKVDLRKPKGLAMTRFFRQRFVVKVKESLSVSWFSFSIKKKATPQYFEGFLVVLTLKQPYNDFILKFY
jgi:hypothetical protein